MTEAEFVAAVLEQIFVQGFDCINQRMLVRYAQQEKARLGAWPDVAAFAQQCVKEPALTEQAISPDGLSASTAGANKRWLAVHEAGHAIVGVQAGLYLLGVRFCGEDEMRGQAKFEDWDWAASTDEDLLRQHIRVDVAGNMAEMRCHRVGWLGCSTRDRR